MSQRTDQTVQTAAPKFESTYKRLFKAFAAASNVYSDNPQDLINIVKDPNAKVANDIPAEVAKDAAKAGKIRSLTRVPNERVTDLETRARSLIEKLAAKAADTTDRSIPAGVKQSLDSICAENKPVIMGLSSQLSSIEEMRLKIFTAIEEQRKAIADAIKSKRSTKPDDQINAAEDYSKMKKDLKAANEIYSTLIGQLEKDAGRYNIEVSALQAKLEIFLTKVQDRANSVVPGIHQAEVKKLGH